METFLLICLGAGAGANLRYFLGMYLARHLPPALPYYATTIINVTGSFALGLFLYWSASRPMADPRWRLLLAVGFCGGYTTYSGFALESLALLTSGQWKAFTLNLVATNVLCLAAVASGAYLGRLVGLTRA